MPLNTPNKLKLLLKITINLTILCYMSKKLVFYFKKAVCETRVCIADFELTSVVYAKHFGHKKHNWIWKMPSVLLTETIALHLEGQERWPDDAKLYLPLQDTQVLLPDYSNCLAVQAYLKMCGLKFDIIEKHNAEYMSPTGKVPFIKCGSFLVSEFEPIMTFLQNKGININEDLTVEEKADMRAYMSLTNNIMYNAELYMCWFDQEIYDHVTWKRYGSIFAWPLNYFVTWQKRRMVKKKLALLDWSNKSMVEVLQDVESCCATLSDRLDNNHFFFGDKPTGLDALVFGHMFSILTTLLPGNKLGQIVQHYPKLIELCKRIEKKYFQV